MKESYPSLQPGVRLSADRINSVSDLSRRSANQRVSNNMYRTQDGVVIAPSAFEIYVEMQGSNLLDGIWDCNSMYFDSGDNEWKKDSEQEYEIDTRAADAGFVVGDAVRAIWDLQREMFVPTSIPPQLRIGEVANEISGVVYLHEAIPFQGSATQRIDPLNSLTEVIPRAQALSEGEIVYVAWVSKGGFDYTNGVWLSGWEMNKAVC